MEKIQIKRNYIDLFFRTACRPDLAADLDSLSVKDIGSYNTVINITDRTPYVYRKLGLPAGAVKIYRDKLARAVLKGPDDSRHGHKDSVDLEIITRVFKQLANPYYVFQSSDKKSFVGIYDVKGLDNNPVIISLCAKQKNKEIEINFITSIYGKKENSISRWGMFPETRLLYADDTKKATELSFMLQSQVKANSVAYKANICYKSVFVKDLGEKFEKKC